MPGFNRTEYSPAEAFCDFVSKSYVAVPEEYREAAARVFGNVTEIEATSEAAFITEPLTEAEFNSKIEELGAPVLSRIRFI